MNILLCSVPFRPSVGGIETVSALLAECFHRMGHRVIVVTQTPGAGPDAEGFEVVRQPSAARMFELVRWAQVVFHNNISLKFAWPQWLLRRPWVVAHHTWIPTTGMAAGLKRWAIRHASNIAVSHAVAESLPVDCTIVPNPYADDVFVRVDNIERSRELVFVGRLVSDKGVDVLLDALGLLATRGRRVGLTVIGEGPELPALRRQGAELGGWWQAAPALRLTLAYTWTQARFREGVLPGSAPFFQTDIALAGRTVPLVPAHQLAVGAAWKPMTELTLSASARKVGSAVMDNDEGNTLAARIPGYTLVDLRAAWDTRRWQAALAVNNLFDRSYFNYGVRSASAFTPDRYNAYPLPGRTALATLTYRFQ